MEQPTITPGDLVQVRRMRAGEPVESAEGTVETVTDGSITLGTQTYAIEDGWTWELVRSSRPLPKRISEIRAQLFGFLEPVVLMGKGEVWMDQFGTVVPVDSIRWFEEVED